MTSALQSAMIWRLLMLSICTELGLLYIDGPNLKIILRQMTPVPVTMPSEQLSL